jgi:hypothetical protein
MRRPDAAIVGAIGWWSLNIGVLYACFEPSATPPLAVLIQAFFVGIQSSPTGNYAP